MQPLVPLRGILLLGDELLPCFPFQAVQSRMSGSSEADSLVFCIVNIVMTLQLVSTSPTICIYMLSPPIKTSKHGLKTPIYQWFPQIELHHQRSAAAISYLPPLCVVQVNVFTNSLGSSQILQRYVVKALQTMWVDQDSCSSFSYAFHQMSRKTKLRVGFNACFAAGIFLGANRLTRTRQWSTNDLKLRHSPTRERWDSMGNFGKILQLRS